PLRFARPPGRLVMAVSVLVMAAAGYWACTGSIVEKADAPGLLTHAGGSYTVQSPFAGQVVRAHAKENQLLSPNATLLTIRTERGDREITALDGGRLTTLLAGVGSVVRTGTDVASLEQVRGADEPLLAVLYAPGGSGSTIPVGAPVDLAVSSAPRERYGVLHGKVRAVGRVPQDQRRIAAFLGDAQLAARFTRAGDPVAVVVELRKDAATESGHAWSSTGGPPFRLDSRTPVTGTVHLSTRRPVEWLLP
ncbi:hypothetical protein, partial [Streptomyces alkaliterrae]